MPMLKLFWGIFSPFRMTWGFTIIWNCSEFSFCFNFQVKSCFLLPSQNLKCWLNFKWDSKFEVYNILKNQLYCLTSELMLSLLNYLNGFVSKQNWIWHGSLGLSKATFYPDYSLHGKIISDFLKSFTLFFFNSWNHSIRVNSKYWCLMMSCIFMIPWISLINARC